MIKFKKHICILIFSIIILSCQFEQKQSQSKIVKDYKVSVNNQISNKEVLILFDSLVTKRNNNSYYLFEKYPFSLKKGKDSLLILDFEKCKVFTDEFRLKKIFQLKDSSKWQEHLLKHNHYFYTKNNNVIVLDLLGGNLKNNECDYDGKMTIDIIRVYSKKQYKELSSKYKNTPYFLESITEHN